MPAGPGSVDAQGIYQYGEADVESLASDLLNLGQVATSAAFLARVAPLEAAVAASALKFCELANSKSIPNATVITLGATAPDYAFTEISDLNSWHDPAINPTRITPIAGRYRVTFAVAWTGNSTGVRFAHLGINGSFLDYRRVLQTATIDSFGTVIASGEFTLNGTDYIEGRVYQSSGVALATNALLTVTRVGG